MSTLQTILLPVHKAFSPCVIPPSILSFHQPNQHSLLLSIHLNWYIQTFWPVFINGQQDDILRMTHTQHQLIHNLNTEVGVDTDWKAHYTIIPENDWQSLGRNLRTFSWCQPVVCLYYDVMGFSICLPTLTSIKFQLGPCVCHSYNILLSVNTDFGQNFPVYLFLSHSMEVTEFS